MKRFPVSARRLFGIALATVAGAAMLAVAAPANAAVADEQLSVGHTDQCLPNGQREVTWTVTSSRDVAAALTGVTLTSNPAGSGFVDGNIIKVGATLPAAPATLVDKQLLPGNAVGASLHVATVFGSGEFLTPVAGDGSVAFESPCTPLYTVAQDCHGITFTFKAPPVGAKEPAINVTLHPSVGSDQAFSINPGDPDKTVTVAGVPGLTVDLSYGDSFKASYAWSHDPCPSLPVTGSSLTGVVGVGAGLLVGGIALIVLLFVLRRRRTVTSA